MKSLLLALIVAVATVSCSTLNKDVTPSTLDFVVVDPEKTPELKLNPVTWQAWNQKRLLDEGANESNKDKVYFVLSQEELAALLDNLASISDGFAKSVETNNYWQKAVNDYRQKKADVREVKE